MCVPIPLILFDPRSNIIRVIVAIAFPCVTTTLTVCCVVYECAVTGFRGAEGAGRLIASAPRMGEQVA